MSYWKVHCRNNAIWFFGFQSKGSYIRGWCCIQLPCDSNSISLFVLCVIHHPFLVGGKQNNEWTDGQCFVCFLSIFGFFSLFKFAYTSCEGTKLTIKGKYKNKTEKRTRIFFVHKNTIKKQQLLKSCIFCAENLRKQCKSFLYWHNVHSFIRGGCQNDPT